ncbi:hypothetical protein VMCG_05090 [Cytospora schulzeri]|uniref:Plasmid pRiA4b Orf3-like domain-containing protein n=1 Tax=Cytospora schulzeri TaxID=448051 RepID=A0A423WM16_9PEZI|nr:hypothetical protein VMCG_05090 [Valsa malicola]
MRPNYIIKCHLHPDHINNPAVIRTLSCPADGDFYTMHLALQLAFGWATTHSFDFAVLNPSYSPPTDVMQMVDRLGRQHGVGGGVNPALEPPEYLFRITDPVVRTQFSGIDRMHEGQRQHPHTKEKGADAYKLHQLFEDAKWQGKKLVYTYDFGDNWEHFLTVEGRCDRTRDFQVLSGTGHYVAEDVGSIPGWENLKAAYQARNPTSEQKERRGWFENMSSNGNQRGLAGDRVNLFENKDEINRNLRYENICDYFERHADEHENKSAARLKWLTGKRGC